MGEIIARNMFNGFKLLIKLLLHLVGRLYHHTLKFIYVKIEIQVSIHKNLKWEENESVILQSVYNLKLTACVLKREDV